jgi:AcrR family transcriptional regulator
MVSKEDILAETFNLFAEHGYHTTSDDISGKVKLKRQSFMHDSRNS